MARKAVDPPGDCRSDAWFMHQLALRLIAKAKASNDPLDEPLRALDWWYPEDRTGRAANGSRARGNQRLEHTQENAQRSTSNAQRQNEEGIVFGNDRDGNAASRLANKWFC